MATRLIVGEFSPSVVMAVARRTGRLTEAGLEVDEVPVESSPAQFRSLLAGELGVALTSPDNVLAYRFSPRNPLGQLADVRIVSAVDRGLGLALYGRPGLDTADRLRGARVGVDVPTSGFALAMYRLTESLGVGRDEYELVTLGSTPRRLRALVAGECDATMLNAGNELVAEEQGCTALATVAEVCSPYLGTVVSTAGEARSAEAQTLARALSDAIDDILDGDAGDVAAAEAATLLALSPELARRYVARLRDPREGLVPHGRVDRDALSTIVKLRRHYLPEVVDGADVLAAAGEPRSGLIAETPAGA
jgi:ABC-type nitrate/sulfonate/bicarbonate transport system substrate-binding protein